MHPRSIAYRNEQARKRIAEAAGVLADRFGLPALQSVTEPERRDFGVAQMRELEHIASLLIGVAGALKGDTPDGSEG